MKCQCCNKSFSKISTHWSQSTCGYPNLSETEYEIVKGLLLGDGSIAAPESHNKKNGSICVESINPNFLVWLSEQSKIFCQPNLKQHFEDENKNSVYRINSYSIPKISDIRERWYPKGEKYYPEDLSLRKLSAKIWYCGDGGLNWSDYSGKATIKCSSQSNRPRFLKSFFKDVGLNPTFRQERICFNSGTSKFLEWIGKPLSGFEYKWETVDRDSYNTLKNYSTTTLEPVYRDEA